VTKTVRPVQARPGRRPLPWKEARPRLRTETLKMNYLNISSLVGKALNAYAQRAISFHDHE
jgi:hypothetical protein